ncbi:MAG TPA: chemotaxis protein CheW, partial [Gemmatimonadaceae bacterium]
APSPAPSPARSPAKRTRRPARKTVPVEPAAAGDHRPAATPESAAPSLPDPVPDPLQAAASIAERIAALAAEDAPAPSWRDGDDEEEPSGPLPPLRERARQRAGIAQLLLFRVGDEWFATDLAAAEEAIELPQVHHVPEMPESMLGMFDLRGSMLPIYAPTRTLGVALRSASAATIVLRGADQRVGIAVDDVEDVFTLDLAQLRDLPGSDDADGVVLGVARHGTDLVAVLDAEALVAACLSDRVMESV